MEGPHLSKIENKLAPKIRREEKKNTSTRSSDEEIKIFEKFILACEIN